MTAHRPKPTITPERVEWFARYYSTNQAWGVFHACLDDGNWECGAADHMLRPGTGVQGKGLIREFISARYDFGRDEGTADLREHAEWFDSLTPSQRRRLGQKAERKATDLGLMPRPWAPSDSKPVVVTKIDVAAGTITLETKP